MRLAKDEQIQTPLTSLIDIVFLLIIFFVVTTDLQQDVIDRQVNLAKSYYIPEPEAGADPNSVVINLRYNLESDTSEYRIGGSLYDLGAIRDKLSKAQKNLGNTVPVTIRADVHTPYRQIRLLNDAIHKAGLYRVSHTAQDERGS